MTMDETVERNLEKMLNREEGGMEYLIRNESMGGNAYWRGDFPCAGTFFNYDPTNGEIKYFGNRQDVPQDIRENFPEGFFRVAIKNLDPLISEIIEYFPITKLPEDVQQILRETVKAYNTKQKIKALKLGKR